jgi:8-oxo-dGTP pyrophosphatase MutT (NUDIX family)
MAEKPAWLYQQSAVIPFLRVEGVLNVVLITSNSSGHWVFPKGVIERDMTPEESAAKEALEEAGVAGTVSDEMISVYEYEKWGGTCHVQVFPLAISEVLETWDEMNQRQRKIVEASEAIDLVKPALKHILEEFVSRYKNRLA